MEQDSGSRLAELTTELLGAKAAAEFLKEAWEFVDDETKKKLANRLVDRTLEMIERNDWSVEQVIREVIQNTMLNAFNEEVATRQTEIERKAREIVAKDMESYLEKAIPQMLDTARREVSAQIRDGIDRALRCR